MGVNYYFTEMYSLTPQIWRAVKKVKEESYVYCKITILQILKMIKIILPEDGMEAT